MWACAWPWSSFYLSFHMSLRNSPAILLAEFWKGISYWYTPQPNVRCAFIYPLFVSTVKMFLSLTFLFIKFKGQAGFSIMWIPLFFSVFLSLPVWFFHLLSFHPIISRKHCHHQETFLSAFIVFIKCENYQLHSGCL